MSSLTSTHATLAFLLAVPSVFGHAALWDPSTYGFNASGLAKSQWFDQPINTAFIKNPLRKDFNYNFDQWWFHGMRGATPNSIMDLPAGGTITVELACNKGLTQYGTNPEEMNQPGDFPCPINVDSKGVSHYGDPSKVATNGVLHTASAEDAKGCGLAIAYTNDVYSITPETFVVFSTNHTCLWTRHTQFQIPANMPPCPNGKCICSWNWIHGNMDNEGYGNEIYMNGFDCNISGSTSNVPLATSKTPVLCDYDSSVCVQGAKQGLYWQGAQPDGWNIPYNASTRNPPFYNSDWGFADGAQNDIFADGNTASSSASGSSSSAQVSASASAASTSGLTVDKTRRSTLKKGNTAHKRRAKAMLGAKRSSSFGRRA